MASSAVASDDSLEEAGSEWQDWNSDEDGGDDTGAVSLFDATRWPDAETALAHDAVTHGFDLRSFRRDVRVAPTFGRRLRANGPRHSNR